MTTHWDEHGEREFSALDFAAAVRKAVKAFDPPAKKRQRR